MTAITTIEQSFIADDEPLAQLTSALFQLLNNSAFDALPHHSKSMVMWHTLDHRGMTDAGGDDGGHTRMESVSELIPGLGGES